MVRGLYYSQKGGEIELDRYQELALSTAIYPSVGTNLVYPTLGLAGEAGELANKVKKIERDGLGELDLDAWMALIEEAGDALWYIAALAHELGVTLDDVAVINVHKLIGRAERGTLQGIGDTR